MKYLKVILILLMSSSVWSQVEVKDKIVLTSADSSQRTVTGIAYPLAPTNAANAGSVITGQLIYAEAAGINLLFVNLSPAPTQYVQGMTLNFKATSGNTGPVQVQLNGLGPVSLKKNGNRNLDSFDIVAGQLVTAIYDGTNFQVLSNLNKRCPAGFVDVNKDYCIEIIERDTNTWFNATKICGDLNYRLCTMSEWSYSCQQSALLGLINMNDNLEWIDSAANSAGDCKGMGVDQADIGGCHRGYTISCGANITFRCCYSK